MLQKPWWCGPILTHQKLTSSEERRGERGIFLFLSLPFSLSLVLTGLQFLFGINPPSLTYPPCSLSENGHTPTLLHKWVRELGQADRSISIPWTQGLIRGGKHASSQANELIPGRIRTRKEDITTFSWDPMGLRPHTPRAVRVLLYHQGNAYLAWSHQRKAKPRNREKEWSNDTFQETGFSRVLILDI